jgi:hypothetical protein
MSHLAQSSLSIQSYLFINQSNNSLTFTHSRLITAGQVLGLMEFGTYNMRDIRKYHSTFFGKKVPLMIESIKVMTPLDHSPQPSSRLHWILN